MNSVWEELTVSQYSVCTKFEAATNKLLRAMKLFIFS